MIRQGRLWTYRTSFSVWSSLTAVLSVKEQECRDPTSLVAVNFLCTLLQSPPPHTFFPSERGFGLSFVGGDGSGGGGGGAGGETRSGGKQWQGRSSGGRGMVFVFGLLSPPRVVQLEPAVVWACSWDVCYHCYYHRGCCFSGALLLLLLLLLFGALLLLFPAFGAFGVLLIRGPASSCCIAAVRLRRVVVSMCSLVDAPSVALPLFCHFYLFVGASYLR